MWIRLREICKIFSVITLYSTSLFENTQNTGKKVRILTYDETAIVVGTNLCVRIR